MEHSRTNGKLVLLKFLHGFILLWMITCPESAALHHPTLLGNESDCLALLDFKKRITGDPLNVMSSWNHSIDICCWVGVSCHHSTKRVLKRSLPPSIGNLTYITGLNLGKNIFHGEIPQEIGRLRSLQYLNLSRNSFSGKIPTNISHCARLRMLNLEVNGIIGSFPIQLISLLRLTHLRLSSNNLTGTIPPWMGNFSLLSSLHLGENRFQGSIPNELGHITSLEEFVVEVNDLSVLLRTNCMESYHQISAQCFLISYNYTDLNKFRGNIPISLSNASRLQTLELEFKYLKLTPTNTGAFCDKIIHLTDCAGGNYQVGDNIGVVGSGPLARLSDNSTDTKKQKVTSTFSNSLKLISN
ncbi:hypothetical protein DVH24_014772 [Malus domestica]|uniref:Uncharacterized protein n=1 Tax=Malus domestica TaxID=3750 RepID=A0A498K6Y1_MALDO|nr:hypothetical protein DVH24_014772 [Malus domestica]